MGKKTKRLRRQLARSLAKLDNAKAYSRGMLTTAAAHEKEAEVLRPLAAYERDLESSMEDLQEAMGSLSPTGEHRKVRRAVGRLMEALDRRKKGGPPEPPVPLRFVVEARSPKEPPTLHNLFLQVIRSEEGGGETLEILGEFVGVERGPAPSGSSAWAEEDGPYKERIVQAVLRWEGEPTDPRTPARSAPSPAETLATLQAAKAESFGRRYSTHRGEQARWADTYVELLQDPGGLLFADYGPLEARAMGYSLETASGEGLDWLAKYVGLTRRTQTLGAYTEEDAHLRSRITLEVRERAYTGKPLEDVEKKGWVGLHSGAKGDAFQREPGETDAELRDRILQARRELANSEAYRYGRPVGRWLASELDAHFQAKPLSMEEAHEILHPSGVTSLGPHPMTQDFMDRLQGCGHLWHLVHPGHQGPCPGCGAA